MPAAEQAISAASRALGEAQVNLPPLRDAAEAQQRKVLAMTQEHHDAQVGGKGLACSTKNAQSLGGPRWRLLA